MPNHEEERRDIDVAVKRARTMIHIPNDTGEEAIGIEKERAVIIVVVNNMVICDQGFPALEVKVLRANVYTRSQFIENLINRCK